MHKNGVTKYSYELIINDNIEFEMMISSEILYKHKMKLKQQQKENNINCNFVECQRISTEFYLNKLN